MTCIISPPLEISVTGRNGLVYAPSLWIKAPNWLWCREIYIWNIYHLYLILLMRCTELRSIISLLLNNNCTSLTLFGRMKLICMISNNIIYEIYHGILAHTCIHLQQYIHHCHVINICVTLRFTNNLQAACMAFLIFHVSLSS